MTGPIYLDCYCRDNVSCYEDKGAIVVSGSVEIEGIETGKAVVTYWVYGRYEDGDGYITWRSI